MEGLSFEQDAEPPFDKINRPNDFTGDVMLSFEVDEQVDAIIRVDAAVDKVKVELGLDAAVLVDSAGKEDAAGGEGGKNGWLG